MDTNVLHFHFYDSNEQLFGVCQYYVMIKHCMISRCHDMSSIIICMIRRCYDMSSIIYTIRMISRCHDRSSAMIRERSLR